MGCSGLEREVSCYLRRAQCRFRSEEGECKANLYQLVYDAGLGENMQGQSIGHILPSSKRLRDELHGWHPAVQVEIPGPRQAARPACRVCA